MSDLFAGLVPSGRPARRRTTKATATTKGGVRERLEFGEPLRSKASTEGEGRDSLATGARARRSRDDAVERRARARELAAAERRQVAAAKAVKAADAAVGKAEATVAKAEAELAAADQRLDAATSASQEAADELEAAEAAVAEVRRAVRA